MNAYLVIEDGGEMVWVAPTMEKALELAWKNHIANYIDSDEHDTLDLPRAEYELETLQTCSLVAEVGNP